MRVKIADAQGELNDDRRQQVQSANKEFSSQLRSIAGDLGSNLSLSGAENQLRSAFSQLGDAYRQTFAKIDCGLVMHERVEAEPPALGSAER